MLLGLVKRGVDAEAATPAGRALVKKIAEAQLSFLRCYHDEVYGNDWTLYCENCSAQLQVTKDVTRHGEIDITAIEEAGVQYPCLQLWKQEEGQG